MNSQRGISFTEFTYQLLQAYDFHLLHNTYNCTIQIGGSDQWGNILAGLEMMARMDNLNSGLPPVQRARGFGITTPLLTTSAGEKFGKTAGNAIWLDEQKTSVFEFYQVRVQCIPFNEPLSNLTHKFFLKTTDEDVGKYLKMLTLLPVSQIEEILLQHNVRQFVHALPNLSHVFQNKPELRKAQRLLADETTLLVHSSKMLHASTSLRLPSFY
jgi:tyrosyl-tRNA synthetase